MANMVNFGEKPTRRAWNNQLQLADPLARFAIPASNTTFYDGQALGRDASGNIVQMDDTAKAEFIGFHTDITQITVNTTDSVGDKSAHGIDRPQAYVALIAATAVKGQEGKKVWWLYNNQVAFSGLTNWNFAGTVLAVIDSTHVLVLPPWLMGTTQGGEKGVVTINTSPVTLTKWDITKLQVLNSASAMAITLPAASSVSPSDSMSFVNVNAASGTPTITPAGSDKINGGTSYTGSTTQYAQFTLRTDGVSNWWTVTPNASGTLGATTFTGAIAVSGAVTVTDAANNALAVGANGATNPVLDVDASVSSVATGLQIQGQAAGSGVKIIGITGGTNEDMLILPAGTGGFKITSSNSATAGFAVYGTGVTNPAFAVNASTSGTGIKITSAAAASGVAIQAVSSNASEAITIDAKAGAGITLAGAASTATGVTIGSSTSAANIITTVYSSNATAFQVGPNGATTPTFLVVCSTSSAKTGLSVTGAANTGGVALAATGGNGNEKFTIDAVGSGPVLIGSVSTGGCNVRAAYATVAAAGTAIGNAAAVTEGYTLVTAANNGNAVKLPAGAIGMRVVLQNGVTTATLQVFPQVNNAIANLANNAVYNIPNGAERTFTYTSAGQWWAAPQTIV